MSTLRFRPHAPPAPEAARHFAGLLLPAPDAFGTLLVLAAAVAVGVGAGSLRHGLHGLGLATLVAGTALYALAVARVATPAIAVLLTLIVAQAGHALEHVLQLTQLYVLDLPGVAAQGFLVVANQEGVHAAWSTGVLLGAVIVLVAGLRGPWAWALVAWSLLHAGEHAYLLARFLEVQSEMARLGLPPLGAAQALPGILGRDGWLASSAFASFCRAVPGLTDAPRPVVHFVWNAGELVLLLAAATGWRTLARSRHDLSPPSDPASGRVRLTDQEP